MEVKEELLFLELLVKKYNIAVSNISVLANEVWMVSEDNPDNNNRAEYWDKLKDYRRNLSEVRGLGKQVRKQSIKVESLFKTASMYYSTFM